MVSQKELPKHLLISLADSNLPLGKSEFFHCCSTNTPENQCKACFHDVCGLHQHVCQEGCCSNLKDKFITKFYICFISGDVLT